MNPANKNEFEYAGNKAVSKVRGPFSQKFTLYVPLLVFCLDARKHASTCRFRVMLMDGVSWLLICFFVTSCYAHACVEKLCPKNPCGCAMVVYRVIAGDEQHDDLVSL